jgi:hypothetical protein
VERCISVKKLMERGSSVGIIRSDPIRSVYTPTFSPVGSCSTRNCSSPGPFKFLLTPAAQKLAPPLEQGSSGGSAAVWPPDLAGNSAEERLATAHSQLARAMGIPPALRNLREVR